MTNAIPFIAAVLVTATVASATPAITEQPTSSEGNPVEYLDNGIIRIGIDLSIGGAITYLADKENGINMVNSHDWGRQIQMSFYAGPKPFEPNGKKPKANWSHLGWNPIQSGDAYGNRSKVLEFTNDGESLYVKCIPMHWPLDNEAGECTFETWIQLNGSTVRVRSRINNRRSDKTQYPARSQELPAIYTNGPWYRLITYTGSKPYSAEALTEIPIKEKKPGVFPWSRFHATESWAALVDQDGRGLGVWAPGVTKFLGGFHGAPGAGGPKEGPTGYLSPIHDDILDHNIEYEYAYQLILGDIDEIRAHVYEHTKGPTAIFDFASDRQHWIYKNAHDSGWPIEESLHVALEQDKPALLSPENCWLASDYDTIEITAAFKTDEKVAHLQFKPFAPDASMPKAISFKVIPDGKERVYKIKLKGKPGYKGAIQQFILHPSKQGAPGNYIELRKVELIPNGK